MVYGYFLKCTLPSGGSLSKASKLSKNVRPKLSAASCGKIQVFFIVLYAQYLQNTTQCFRVECYGFSKLQWTPAPVSIVSTKTAETPPSLTSLGKLCSIFKRRTLGWANKNGWCRDKGVSAVFDRTIFVWAGVHHHFEWMCRISYWGIMIDADITVQKRYGLIYSDIIWYDLMTKTRYSRGFFWEGLNK